MPLKIRAQVVDIRSDIPRVTDSFLVDTNIWLFLHYPPASRHSETGDTLQQAIDYPEYIKKAIVARAGLKHVGLMFSELAHNIERVERKIYSNQCNREKSPKEYRHDYPMQRIHVTKLVSDMWSDVQGMSALIDAQLCQSFLNDSVRRFKLTGLDGYDAFIVEAATRAGITQVLTDDCDFATVPGLVVFTANQRAIAAAQTSRKLVAR